MIRYKLLLGVTFSALEDEINRMVAADSSAALVNAFFAQSTGFIGAMSYDGTDEGCAQTRQKAKSVELRQKPNPKKAGGSASR